MSNPLNSIFLEERCRNALKTCNFAGPNGEDCASKFCLGFPGTTGTCPQLGLNPQNCCGSSDPATCLAKWVKTGGGVVPNVCASVVSIFAGCSSASPVLFPSNSIYASGPQATALAGCLCVPDPKVLDGFASECVASGRAAHPTYYPYASLLIGFCESIWESSATASGAVVAATISADGTSTTATDPASTGSSQQTTETSSGSTITPSAVLSSSNIAASSTPASSTSTSSSTRAIKNNFQRSIVLLSVSILLSLY